MRDKRPVDELSIEELERILAMRKREARMARLRRYDGNGRRVLQVAEADDLPVPQPEAKVSANPKPILSPVVPIPTVYYEGDPRFEDDFEAARRPTGGKSRQAMIMNRLLLGVEIAAVFGLILLLVGVFDSLQTLSQTTAKIETDAQATANARLIPPTPTALINVTNIVLPAGHKYNGDQSSFNLEEVPVEYRPQAQALISLSIVRPTPSPGEAFGIQIPKLNVKSRIVYGDDWEALKLGVGHHIGSANPGEQGNMVLAAHDDIYGELFRHLDELAPGDEILVSATNGKDYRYVVEPQKDTRGQVVGHQFLKPTDVWVLGSRPGSDKYLTLISCYPYQVDTQRIVVFATLKNS